MRGWLIVNPFLDTQKFQEIYGLLCASAKAEGMELEMKTAAELMCPSGDDFKGFALPDFCIFWDKDVYLAKRLEAAGLRLFNSAAAVEGCDNKILTAAVDSNGKTAEKFPAHHTRPEADKFKYSAGNTVGKLYTDIAAGSCKQFTAVIIKQQHCAATAVGNGKRKLH